MKHPNDPGICSICRLRHDNIGYMPTSRHPIKWCCLECLNTHNDTGTIVKGAYSMRDFDAYERAALVAGGNKGGEYLESIDKTDLAALSKEEWEIFLAQIMDGYVTDMRERLGSGRAPF